MIDTVLALCRAIDVFDLREKSANAFSAAGFHAAYYIAPLNAVRSSKALMANTGFPEDWEKEYRTRGHKVDPLPWIALTATHPVLWDQLPEGAKLTRPEQDYLASLPRWGMQAGVGITTYGPSARIGFVGVGFPTAAALAHPDLDLLRVIAQTSFLRYCELIKDEIGDMPELSPRELDVLTRISQGKTKLAIAEELDVSKDTVDTYFRRIYAKLDVSDRGAAVATAVARGALVPSDMRVSRAMVKRQPDPSLTEDQA